MSVRGNAPGSRSPQRHEPCDGSPRPASGSEPWVGVPFQGLAGSYVGQSGALPGLAWAAPLALPGPEPTASFEEPLSPDARSPRTARVECLPPAHGAQSYSTEIATQNGREMAEPRRKSSSRRGRSGDVFSQVTK